MLIVNATNVGPSLHHAIMKADSASVKTTWKVIDVTDVRYVCTKKENVRLRFTTDLIQIIKTKFHVIAIHKDIRNDFIRIQERCFS